MRSHTYFRRNWYTHRRGSITREVLDNGHVQYTVRISDKGREKPFIENSFDTPEQAESFLQRIRKESEVRSPFTDPPVVREKLIELDVHCCVCGDTLTPDETEMEFFRLGFPVHLLDVKPECIDKLHDVVKERMG